MREILFRGRRIGDDKSKWFYGDLHQTEKDFKKVVEIIDWGTKPYIHKIDSSTIGQYTGLKDKNGVKIFEGDILKVESVDIDCNTANYFGGEVLFLQDIGLFALDLGYDYLSFNTMKEATGYIYSYEVIGNIHDNSNIIKQ